VWDAFESPKGCALDGGTQGVCTGAWHGQGARGDARVRKGARVRSIQGSTFRIWGRRDEAADQSCPAANKHLLMCAASLEILGRLHISYIISYHIISYHIVLYYIILYHFVLYYALYFQRHHPSCPSKGGPDVSVHVPPPHGPCNRRPSDSQQPLSTCLRPMAHETALSRIL